MEMLHGATWIAFRAAARPRTFPEVWAAGPMKATGRCGRSSGKGTLE
jgi:hypothetical protein